MNHFLPLSARTACLAVLLFLLPPSIYSQEGTLIGLVDQYLVAMDPASGDLTQITTVNVPANHNLLYLTYSTSDCLFYSILDPIGLPTLVSIDWEGQYTEIGPLSISGGTVYFCGGLSFNPTDGQLYIGASLNGDIANQDYYAEAILQVDATNANCSLVSTLTPGGTAQTDIDNITFIGNELFIHDGVPLGAEQSYFYSLDFASLGPTATPTLNTTSSYYPMRDMGPVGTIIYFTTLDLELFAWNTETGAIDLVGLTSNTFNNQPVAGLEYVVPLGMVSLNVSDTLLCEGETLTLSTGLGNVSHTWSTGESGEQITVAETGSYWAEVQENNCVFTTDTVFIEFQICDACDSLFNLIQNELFIGQDTTICEGELLALTLNLDQSFSISWNNGDVGPQSTVNAAGEYWATVLSETCTFTTNTLQLSTVNCTSCEYYIPNVFSPQADGVNDIFQVYFNEENCQPVSLKLSIFDRWGNMLVETEQNRWDGTFRGSPAAPGTYIYVIEVEQEYEGKLITKTESGSVTLLR